MAKKPEMSFDLPDFTKMMAEFRLPAVDMEAFLAAQRRNLESLSAANRVALEGAQAVAKRHMEIMQQSMTDMTESMKALSAPGAAKDKAAQQAEMLKGAYEKAVANMKEIADLIQKSNSEALAVLNRRFTEAMDEMKTMLAKSSG